MTSSDYYLVLPTSSLALPSLLLFLAVAIASVSCSPAQITPVPIATAMRAVPVSTVIFSLHLGDLG